MPHTISSVAENACEKGIKPDGWPGLFIRPGSSYLCACLVPLPGRRPSHQVGGPDGHATFHIESSSTYASSLPFSLSFRDCLRSSMAFLSRSNPNSSSISLYSFQGIITSVGLPFSFTTIFLCTVTVASPLFFLIIPNV